MKIFKKNDIDVTFCENMFFDFFFNSIDENCDFDIFVNEMIDIDNEFIFDELFSNFVKKIENVFIEFEKIRHFHIFVFFIDERIEIRR